MRRPGEAPAEPRPQDSTRAEEDPGILSASAVWPEESVFHGVYL
ncbi:hypothetical protein TVNIR_1368 [Thioalkalivibrio nitratireducens DSM 14787]|uniref:Uncharacterized protein n=1 Tax=Thioalkalivibrio nitratireducens (strain DSM 14787 / UNIQEM 213 / ALEN2) TaxID=1255043 RepID=L0DTW3_THIND|nr:hypothetical protein TVNIR_1368 [Thioalkalivibrio nitratireducens DSM 14787]